MTINGSVTRHTGVMSERETLEAFSEGAKKAASAARELAKETQNSAWLDTANVLESICQGGLQLSNMRSMSRLETLMAANIKADPKKFIN